MSAIGIVEEVRDARRKHAERFNYDLHAICEDLKKKEKLVGIQFIGLQGGFTMSTLSVRLPESLHKKIKMIELLPENQQENIAAHLREYIADLEDEI